MVARFCFIFLIVALLLYVTACETFEGRIENKTVSIDPNRPVTFKRECPFLETNAIASIWQNGSVIYYKNRAIWEMEPDSKEPSILLDLTAKNVSWLRVVPNSSFLLTYSNDEESYYLVYDLNNLSRTEQHIVGKSGHFYDVLPDQRIRLETRDQHTFGEGATFDILEINLELQKAYSYPLTLDLPGYQFYYEPFYTGILSLSPSTSVVLYTLIGDGGTADVALREYATQTTLWQQRGLQGTHGYPFPAPKWSSDGRFVLFGMPREEQGTQYYKIFYLSAKGELTELPQQPFPLTDELFQIQELSLSPNGQYLYYNLGFDPLDTTAVIIDFAESEARIVCDETTSFLGGMWTAENQFLLEIKTETGNRRLRMLDVPSWTVQDLGIEEPGLAYGWLPSVAVDGE